MYKILITLLISCISGNLFGACPATISGGYSGYSTKTEINKQSNTVSNVKGKLFVSFIDGKGTATKPGIIIIKRIVVVDAASADGITNSAPSSQLPYLYDKSSCIVTINDPEPNGTQIIFVVANSGNTLYGVLQDTNEDTGGYKTAVEQLTLTRH